MTKTELTPAEWEQLIQEMHRLVEEEAQKPRAPSTDQQQQKMPNPFEQLE